MKYLIVSIIFTVFIVCTTCITIHQANSGVQCALTSCYDSVDIEKVYKMKKNYKIEVDKQETQSFELLINDKNNNTEPILEKSCIPQVIKDDYKVKIKSTKSKTENVKPIVSINIDTLSESNNFDEGYISYNVPDSMVIGNTYIISLRSSKKYSIKLVEYQTNIVSTTTLEKIVTSKYMSAKLYDYDNMFWIKALNTEKQLVDSDITEWKWAIKPLKSGNKNLKLVIILSIIDDKGEHSKDIPVFDKSIYVEKSFIYSINNFISEYWQWLLSTLVIPLFLYLWKNSKKKE